MNVAHERLDGIDRERVLAAVAPVLSAHAVDAVELLWRMDGGGRVLEVTLERPGSRIPGEDITLELCSKVSRDLSAALDVAEAIPERYRLEVGSPGLERALYGAGDFERFSGQFARVKLKQAHLGQYVLRGTLQGLDPSGQVLLTIETGEAARLLLENIESARLVFQMGGTSAQGGKHPRGRAVGRGPQGQRPSR
jgi:ribosome maturation factor RimP